MHLIELRILSGPSAEIAGPAVRLTLGGSATDPAETGSIAAPDPEEVVRVIAAAAGLPVPEVVVRPGSGDQLVIAFSWDQRGKAQALGEAVAGILTAEEPGVALGERMARAAESVREASPGPGPDLIEPLIPTVAVTGTNGKTTTTRLLARIATEAGLRPGWSSTEGVFVAGDCVEAGDWSGPAGARLVLGDSSVSLAILETARGGLMQRGMSVSALDAAIFTNVSTDHLGLQGLDTVQQLAWAKAAVLRIVRPEGWCVLNAEDPLVRSYFSASPGRPWFFAVDPLGEGAQFARGLGARLTTVRDGRIVVEGVDDLDDIISVAEVPVSLAGLSTENLANALSAASAALGLDLPLAAVRSGLREFRPDMSNSAGRMNIWSVPTSAGGSATVILDFAHNEAGAAALFRVARGLRAPGALVHASIGNAGDRTDEGIAEVGRIAAEAADTVQLAAKSRYLRGRTQAEMDSLQTAGIHAGGGEVTDNLPDEPSGLAALLERAGPGDVIAMMVHQDRDACVTLLAERGALPDGPDEIAAKAAAAAASG